MSDQDYFLKVYKEAVVAIENDIQHTSRYLARTFPEKEDQFYDEVEKFIVRGGKRFRPALSLVTARAFGSDEIFAHLALETFHKYLLAHDDIIDRDGIRYGAPTLHAKMADSFSHLSDKDHFGNSLGIIGGDLMEAATHKIILNSDLSAATKIDLEKLIVQAVEEVSWGWYDQFLMDYLTLDSDKLSFERIESSIIWVTGKYSIKLPLLFGYAVAGQQPPKELETLADMLGALYQTGDDLIGLFGDQKTTGKSNFGDIIQGKKTLPLWYAYTLANAKDKAVLVRVIGNKKATDGEVNEVRSIIERCGAVKKTEELMQGYKQKSLDLIEHMDIPSELGQFFRGFIAYIEKRDR